MGGILVAVMLVGGGVWARHYCRKRARRRGTTGGQGEGGGGKVEARPPSDDSNPDVVPNIGEYTRGGKCCRGKLRDEEKD